MAKTAAHSARQSRATDQDRARGEIRTRVREIANGSPSCPAPLKTDSCLWPHLMVAVEQLSDVTAAVATGLGPALKRAFLQALAERLDHTARQVLVFECALARGQHPATAPSSVIELSSALQHNVAPLIGILEIYPGLDDLLADHVRSSTEYARRLTADLSDEWPAITSRFDWVVDPAEVEVTILRSDHHSGGETVVQFGDRDGRGRVLYKPRRVQLEKLLTDGLQKLAEGSSQLRDWRLPRYLVRPDHGWAEYVHARACGVGGEVARYYYRAGALLAYATTLGITDLHCDNLIAASDSPVPIDLETGLHHRQRPGAPSRGGMVLPRVMEWNSLATGLLPTWIWKGGDRRGVDLSGFGSLGEQWCSIPLQQFVERDTPLEQVIRDGVQLLPSQNVVRLGGRQVGPWEYLDELLGGFQIGLEVLASSTVELEELIDCAGKLEARFLPRPTAGYHYAIQASLHPFHLRDPDLRRDFLTRALTDTTRVEPWLVTAEVEACMHGDIPRFVTQGAARTVCEPYYGDRGTLSEQEHIVGRDAARDDVGRWSDPARLTFERQIISGSMLSLQTAHEGGDPRITVVEGADQEDIAWAAPMSWPAAEAASRFLLDYISMSGNDPDLWYGFRNAPGGHHEFGLIGGDLYSGSAGVAYGLALGYRAGFVDAEIVETLTQRLLIVTEDHLKTQRQRIGGAYFGELSAVLPLISNLRMLGASDEARSLARQACLILAAALAEVAPERHFWGVDLLGGVAGALAVTVSLFRLFREEEYLPVMGRLIAILDESSTPAGSRVVWRQPTISASPDEALGGLSHGQAGCAVALAEAAAVLQELAEPAAARAAQLALAAAGWEIDQFDRHRLSFPDTRRRSAAGEHGEFAWSHGAPGVFLALDRVRRCLPAPEGTRFLAEQPFRHVLETAMADRTPPNNPSLCHGALGDYLLGAELLTACDGEELGPEMGQRLADWARLGSWAKREALPLRRHVVDAPGLLVGRAGNLAGWSAVCTGRQTGLPFLPSAFEA